MLIYGFLLAFLILATITDVRRHKIYNWNTYLGMTAGLLVNAWQDRWMGVESSLLGFLACGFVMLFCFVLFNVGGGDVKLIAMMGAFLGLQKGIEAMLWTFVLGGVCGLAMIIWRHGLLTIIANTFQHLRLVMRARSWIPLTNKERQPLERWLYLAPAAVAAVVLLLVDEQTGFLRRMFG